MADRDAFDDGQTQPHVLPRTRAGLIHPVEAIEDPRQMLSMDSASGIADAHRELALVRVRVDCNGATGGV